MPNTPPNLMAAGNIYPSRFLKMSSTAFKCEQAAANGVVIGVSQEGTNYPPINDTLITIAGYAAIAGQNIRIFGEGDECLLELGDTVTAGQLLKSDANGKGVPILTNAGASTPQYYGARALQGGASGEKIRVQVTIGTLTQT